jgi:hypothetical protein
MLSISIQLRGISGGAFGGTRENDGDSQGNIAACS